MVKGQAEIVENVFTVFFGIIILAAISFLVYNFYTNQIRAEIENNLKQLALAISNNILRLYESGKNLKYSPKANEAAKLAEVDLNLPSQVSGRNYEVILILANPVWVQISNFSVGGIQPEASIVTPPGAKIILRTTQFPEVSVEQDVPNIDVLVQGKIENGLDDTLSYYRCNFNNTIKDYIVIGKQDIIIDISKVS